MPATLPGPPFLATPSRTLFERRGQNRLLGDGHDPTYMALQLPLQRVQRPAR